jgi:hypothetical protein
VRSVCEGLGLAIDLYQPFPPHSIYD